MFIDQTSGRLHVMIMIHIQSTSLLQIHVYQQAMWNLSVASDLSDRFLKCPAKQADHIDTPSVKGSLARQNIEASKGGGGR